MAVAFQLDEHLPHAVARELRRYKIDVVTASDAGRLGAEDRVHIAAAHATRRVLVTQGRDFLGLAQAGPAHSGIVILMRRSPPVGAIVEGLRLMHAVYSAEEMVGRVEYL